MEVTIRQVKNGYIVISSPILSIEEEVFLTLDQTLQRLLEKFERRSSWSGSSFYGEVKILRAQQEDSNKGE